MKITNIKINRLNQPLGFDLTGLSLSWEIGEAGSLEVERYHIQAEKISAQGQKALVFDSQDLAAGQVDTLDYPLPFKAEPRTRYSVRVMASLSDGSQIEESSWFETGKMDEEWTGKYIVSTLEPKEPPCIERSFSLEEKPLSARAYVSGFGVYEIYLDGSKVGNEFLAPGYHSYDLHVQAQTYDVTDYLKAGENKLSFLLGDGWFKGRFCFDGGQENLYGDNYYLIYELRLAYADGHEEVIYSDGSEMCHATKIRFCNIYDGEIYDDTFEYDKTQPVEVKSPDKIGKLCDRYSLPVTKQEQFKVQEVIHTPAGETVYDFGQNMTGWVEFTSHLKKGEKITLTGAEILQDGNFYHDNMRVARTEFVYISDGSQKLVRPHFTFYGFRYMKVEVENLLDAAAEVTKPEAADFTAIHLRSDMEQIGSIETGNEKVDRLFANALWSQKDNSLDLPTDCPQRDERLGWTGDAQIFSDTACFNMDMSAFYRKFLWDMRAEQATRGGEVPNVVPTIHLPMIGDGGLCPWADSAVIIPWNVYRHDGNRTLLREFYPGMKAWIDFEYEKESAEGGLHMIKSGFHFADWLALDNPEPGPIGATDPLFIASAYYMHCSQILSQAAAVLGLEEDADKYHKLSEEIRSAVIETYFDNGLCKVGTQTGQALSIMFHINPETEKESGDILAQLVAENNNHLNTGFVGTPILCGALSETGHHDLAVTLLLNEDYPSWLYCVNLGATTIWERWNSVMPDRHMNSEGMNSLNHYAYGSIEAFMYQYVLGINIVDETPGFKKVIIRPYTDERLPKVSGRVHTPYGEIRVAYERQDDGSYKFDVKTPYGVEAELQLPE